MKFRDLKLKHKEVALIKLDDGTITTIGSINENGGQCDCCQLIDSDDNIEVLKRIKLEAKNV